MTRGTEPKPQGNYEVGYGKPPVHTRFQRGYPGNRKGRPKQRRTGKALFEKALNAPVLVNEGGIQERITRREALFRMLVARAVKGDARAVSMVLRLMEEHDLMKDDYPRSILVKFVNPGELVAEAPGEPERDRPQSDPEVKGREDGEG